MHQRLSWQYILRFSSEDLWFVLRNRAIVTQDADGPPSHPHAQFAQGRGVRIGFFPAKFDAERKKLTWYWFMACAAKENVRTHLLRHIAVQLSAAWPHTLR